MPVDAISSEITFNLQAKEVSARFLLCEITIFPLKLIVNLRGWMKSTYLSCISSNFHIHI